MYLSRIYWRDQEDAKSTQKSGCYCNGSHSDRVSSFHDTLPLARRTPASEALEPCFARVRRAIKKIETQRHRAIASSYRHAGGEARSRGRMGAQAPHTPRGPWPALRLVALRRARSRE